MSDHDQDNQEQQTTQNTYNTSDQQAKFESIKQVNPYGAEYWSARDLAPLLGYDKWERFDDAIDRAKAVCAVAQQNVGQHFVETRQMITIGKGARRAIVDYHLSRYGFHLLLTCSDLRKPEIVQGLGYFTLSSLTTTPDYFALAKTLGVFIPDNLPVTKEQITIGQIKRAFQHLPTSQQYRVGRYLIDLYFPKQLIAVECDEEGHRRYDRQVEEQRQRFIEEQLGCMFVRYNPHAADFNVGEVINQIMLHIYGNFEDE